MATYPEHLEHRIRWGRRPLVLDNPKGPSLWSRLWAWFQMGLVETYQYGVPPFIL